MSIVHIGQNNEIFFERSQITQKVKKKIGINRKGKKSTEINFHWYMLHNFKGFQELCFTWGLISKTFSYDWAACNIVFAKSNSFTAKNIEIESFIQSKINFLIFELV